MAVMSGIQERIHHWGGREVVENRRVRATVWVVAFVLATSFGAHVAVPLPWTPVPMTLQPLFVVLAGALLGPWLGATALATYVAVGAAGAPVFSAGHAGVAWLLGPTGGYLLAYPAAAFVVGWVAGRCAGTVRLAAGLLAGMVVIYAGGVSQLFILTGGEPARLLELGVLPFLGGDLVKLVMALVVTLGVRRGRSADDLGLV